MIAQPLTRSPLRSLRLMLSLTLLCALPALLTSATLALTPHHLTSGAVIAVVDRLEGGWIVLITESGASLDLPCDTLCAEGRSERLREGTWVIYWPELSRIEPLRSEGAQAMSERLRWRVSRLSPLEDQTLEDQALPPSATP